MASIGVRLHGDRGAGGLTLAFLVVAFLAVLGAGAYALSLDTGPDYDIDDQGEEHGAEEEGAEEEAEEASLQGEPLPEPVYAAIDVGLPQEAVFNLLPVEPVDSRTFDAGAIGGLQSAGAECAYFLREGPVRPETFYRLCFAEDVLVEKTVVYGDEIGEPTQVE